jgi:hypothetical protein
LVRSMQLVVRQSEPFWTTVIAKALMQAAMDKPKRRTPWAFEA